MKFTLSEAKKYSKQDKSREWLSSILRFTNNESFAKRVETKGILIGPRLMPLNKLIRCGGPEEGLQFFEAKDVFEKKVNNMAKDIKKGWNTPPLAVWYLNHEYSIADGSHRFEALKKTGIKKYPTFIWFENKKDYDYYKRKELR